MTHTSEGGDASLVAHWVIITGEKEDTPVAGNGAEILLGYYLPATVAPKLAVVQGLLKAECLEKLTCL